jgi:hypothetical protein
MSLICSVFVPAAALVPAAPAVVGFVAEGPVIAAIVFRSLVPPATSGAGFPSGFIAHCTSATASFTTDGAMIGLGSDTLGSPTRDACTTDGRDVIRMIVLYFRLIGARLCSIAALSAISCWLGTGTGRFIASRRSRASSTCAAIGYSRITRSYAFAARVW